MKKEIIVHLVEASNQRTYKVAKNLRILGFIILIACIAFLDVDTLNSIGLSIALALIIAPFALRFIMDEHKKTGIIRFSEGEILVKHKGMEPQVYPLKDLQGITFTIVDFEGETKGSDLLTSASTMNVRSGANNFISWVKDSKDYAYNFKLESEFAKRQVTNYLQSYEKEILNRKD